MIVELPGMREGRRKRRVEGRRERERERVVETGRRGRQEGKGGSIYLFLLCPTLAPIIIHQL